MIRQITGHVTHIDLTTVVIDVNGIGYHVHVTALMTKYMIGQKISLHTHLAVRENALDLYGFLDRDTLEVFELLLTLPKIGPKSAQQILSQADTVLLKQAVRQGDATYLSKMSGIGKKSAEKIVTGLKDKFEYDDNGLSIMNTSDESVLYIRDTIDALISLGYPENNARKIVRQLSETNPEIVTSTDALKAALKLLN